MPFPHTPSEFAQTVVSATASVCTRFFNLMNLAKLVYDTAAFALTSSGRLSDAVKVGEIGWIYGADTGSTDDYAITVDSSLTSYYDGLTIRFRANTANTGAATLNVNALGAKSLRKRGGVNLDDNDIPAGAMVVVIYDQNTDTFQVISSSVAPSISHGMQVYTSGSGNFTVPAGVFAVDVIGVGGGGGGGSTASTATGGGAGGLFRKLLTVTPGQSIAYAVGAAGTAGSGGNAGNGGNTTFGGTLVANGGSGGDAGLGAGGSASGGDLNVAGQAGFAQGVGIGGSDKCQGGNAPLGFGVGGFVQTSTPTSAYGYGAGGAGDADSGGGWQTSAGASGIIIITW